MEELWENFSRESQGLRKSQAELKGTVTEMKNTLEGVDTDQLMEKTGLATWTPDEWTRQIRTATIERNFKKCGEFKGPVGQHPVRKQLCYRDPRRRRKRERNRNYLKK